MTGPRWPGVLDDLVDDLGTVRAVLIGAAALELHDRLDVQTADRDLAVVLEPEEIRARLALLADWTPDDRHPQRWRHRSGVVADVLPAGPETVGRGRHTWPDGAEMSLVGFRHLLDHCEAHPRLRRCEVGALSSIALLKMAAYLDRPSERRKDLRHLGLLLDRYLPFDDDRMWTGPASERGLYNEDASAFLLGWDLGASATDDEAEVVRRFTDLLLDPSSALHRGRLAADAAGSLRGDVPRVERRMRAFSDGFRAGRR